MNRIPTSLRAQLATDPYYRTCARESAECEGRITWEHALIYAGRQVQERFAIIPLCVYHHLGPGLNKRININLAVSRATPGDLAKYPRQTWLLKRPSPGEIDLDEAA